MRGGPRSLRVEELMLANCGIGEDSWESLGQQKIKPVNHKGNQLWIFIERIVSGVPILWPHDVESQLIGKDSDAGKDWRQKERGQQRIRLLDSITDMSLSKFQEVVGNREAWRAIVHGVAKSWKLLGDWTTAEKYLTTFL